MAAPSASRNPRRTQRERVETSTARLLDAAVALFAEQGYDRTSTAQIADRAGYSRALVNARFGSKEGLLEELLTTRWEELLVSAATAGGTGLDRLTGVLDRFTDLARTQPQALRAFLVVSFEAAGPAIALRPDIRDRLGRIEAAFADALATGVADGSVRPDADPALEAREVIHTALGHCFRWVIDDGYTLDELETWRARLRVRLAPPTPARP